MTPASGIEVVMYCSEVRWIGLSTNTAPVRSSATSPEDQNLWEYKNAGIGKMFEAAEVDHHLSSKFRLIDRCAYRAGHNTPLT